MAKHCNLKLYHYFKKCLPCCDMPKWLPWKAPTTAGSWIICNLTLQFSNKISLWLFYYPLNLYDSSTGYNSSLPTQEPAYLPWARGFPIADRIVHTTLNAIIPVHTHLRFSITWVRKDVVGRIELHCTYKQYIMSKRCSVTLQCIWCTKLVFYLNFLNPQTPLVHIWKFLYA